VTSTSPHIIAVAGDPGGANALAPVLETLWRDRTARVSALAYRQALALWRKRNLPCEELAEATTLEEISLLLDRSRPALLLAGTSANSVDLEKLFIFVTREKGVPSLALLDFWSNYALRFADAEGRLRYLPDRIAVMDEQARSEMQTAGFDSQRLVITGQPAFDDLAVLHHRFDQAQRRAVRESVGLRSAELFVLFASQPLSVISGTDDSHPLYPGYNERSVLHAATVALVGIARRKEREILLLVRPHPREDLESLRSVTQSVPEAGAIRVIASAEGDARELVLASDLVIGMTTVLLVEACYLGRPAVSLQPGLRLPDTLPTNRSGLTRAVYRAENVQPVVEEMLFDEPARRAALSRLSGLRLDCLAARRVANLAYEMIGLKMNRAVRTNP
jgi:hypothetical protein